MMIMVDDSPMVIDNNDDDYGGDGDDDSPMRILMNDSPMMMFMYQLSHSLRHYLSTVYLQSSSLLSLSRSGRVEVD